MNGDDIPRDFGFKYIMWVCFRWCYYNPLTIFLVMQAELTTAIEEHPKAKFLSHGLSLLGVIIAQTRNQGLDYTAPIRGRYNEARAASLRDNKQ